MAALYRALPNRLRLFSVPPGTTIVSTDIGLASAILATQARDQAVAVESTGRASSDGSAPFESLTPALAGAAGAGVLPIEAGAAVRSDRVIAVEGSAQLHGDTPAAVEWSGAVDLAADALVPLEGLATECGELSAPAETVALLLLATEASAEWLTTASGAAALMAEALAALVRDERGLTEWLGTGATILADAMLPLEGRGAPPASLLSLESGPGRTRLLETPGRVRLVRRN
ncbi:MAG TPA: hypothetical protein VGM07_10890 [Stellaceae bacterium]|jgi:hypothetical protein